MLFCLEIEHLGNLVLIVQKRLMSKFSGNNSALGAIILKYNKDWIS